ncbi:MAG: T6SS effector amidase Tae4 family protein [Polyangia bacterium]
MLDGRPGADRKRFKGARCWYPGHQGHTLRAQELADWLKGDPAVAGAVEIRRQVTAADYMGRTGLVFFRNFWGEGNQGDHIDLWDGDELRAGAPDYFERSEQVWFWPLPAFGAPPQRVS